MEQVLEPLERAMELTPILGELGYNESHSFNGLLQTTTDGGPSMGESQKVRGLWYAVGIWVKDGPGMGKLIADWMTDGRTASTTAASTTPASTPSSSRRSSSSAVHRDGAKDLQSASASTRAVRGRPWHSPLTVLRAGEGAGRLLHGARRLERAHGYAANEHLLAKFGDRIPVRENEWDNRHFWRVSNAEHLELSENCGIINLSHFYICDIEGLGHVAMMEWLRAAKIGGTPISARASTRTSSTTRAW